MIEHIDYLIDLVGGKSNALTILALFIGIIISLFLYFKTFYRLVYSTERICENIKELGDEDGINNEKNKLTATLEELRGKIQI